MARPRRRRRIEDDDDDDDGNSSPEIRPRLRRRTIENENDGDDQDNYNPSSSASSPEPINLIKESLDNGDLKTNHNDRKFTNFLDLQDRYHKEFMDNLQKHVRESDFSMESLAGNELDRRVCAMGFLDKYGEIYWGTKENREKYLQQDRLKKPKALAVYPDREEELVFFLFSP